MDIFSVLITGANRGIGLEFVRQMVHLKPPIKHIFATYRNADLIQELEDIRDKCPLTTILHLIQMDVTSMDDILGVKEIVERVVEEKGLTVLINNAGAVQAQTFFDIDPNNLNFHFATNTMAPTIITQVMHPLLKLSAARHQEPKMSFSRAAVLNLSSVVGSITNSNTFCEEENVAFSYKVSKAALNMAMRMVAQEIKQDSILVVMMCPGWVKTNMGGETAPVNVEDSIRTMLHTVAELDESHSGIFMDRYGKSYPF